MLHRYISAPTISKIDVNSLITWPAYYASIKSTITTSKPPIKLLSHPSINPTLNNKIIIWRGDITNLQIDAITNAANNQLWAGGGICGAIHTAAGKQLWAECKKIGFCETGDTVVTKAYHLSAKHVLHSVGPMGQNSKQLASCYHSILERCKEYKCRSVALCCISTGIFGFPNLPAANIALHTVRKWLEIEENAAAIDKIVFCLFLPLDVDIYNTLTSYYFPVDEVTTNDNTEENEESTEEQTYEHDSDEYSTCSSSYSSSTYTDSTCSPLPATTPAFIHSASEPTPKS